MRLNSSNPFSDNDEQPPVPMQRTTSAPVGFAPRSYKQDPVAVWRNLSFSVQITRSFVFRAPDVVSIAEFEAELLQEICRLGEWLRIELQTLQATQSNAISELLRYLVDANEAAALSCVSKRAGQGEAERMAGSVKAAFLEQAVLLAAWQKEGDLSSGAAHLVTHTDDAGDFDDSNGGQYVWRVLMLAGICLALIHVAHAVPDTGVRCLLQIVSVLALQLSGVVPNYCVGLLVPVFATALRVLPDRSISETAHLCFGEMMNQMTALVVGSFTINAIFLKCQLEVRFIDAIGKWFGQSPKTFLLMLMLGCMYASAVTFVTLLALSAMLPVALGSDSKGSKGLLLGVGLACTLGGALTPLSGTTSLIVLSAVTKFGLSLDFGTWVMLMLPLSTLTCICAWLLLLVIFGTPPLPEDNRRQGFVKPLRPLHIFFLGCSVLFVLGCATEAKLKPWIGSSGNLGLMLTALSFGSGFLTKADFNAMPWEVLMILFGVNVTSFTLKESGLALSLAKMLIPVQVYNVSLWLELGKITGTSLVLASITGQSVFAPLAIPIVVALGAKLYCPSLTALLAVQAIHCGVFMPHASTDLCLTLEMAGEDKQHRKLNQVDFIGVGLGVGTVGWLFTMTIGYLGGLGLLGVPPQHIIVREPTELIPTVTWLGNETTAAEQVKILKGKMGGKAVNGTIRENVIGTEKLRRVGVGHSENITLHDRRGKVAVEEARPIHPWHSELPMQRLVRWVHHRRLHGRHRHVYRKRHPS